VDFAASATAGRVPVSWTTFLRSDRAHGGTLGRSFVSLLVTGPIEIVVPALLVVILVVMTIARRRPNPQWLSAWWCALVPPLIGAVAWVVVAPDPRFGYGALWSLAAGVCAWAWPGRASRRLRVAFVLVCAGAMLPAFGYRIVANENLYDTPRFTDVPFYGPGPDAGFYPRPSSEMARFATVSGVQVFELGESGSLDWSGELLFTSDRSLVRGLELRDRLGVLSAGFRIVPEPH
jgi:hypothetical protein